MIKIKLTNDQIDQIGVVRAAVLDGYWEDKARADIMRVYLEGMLAATKSLHDSQGGRNHTRLRIRWLKQMLKEVDHA